MEKTKQSISIYSNFDVFKFYYEIDNKKYKRNKKVF